jgi:adenylate cyclase
MATLEERSGLDINSGPARHIRPRHRAASHWPRIADLGILRVPRGEPEVTGKLGGTRRQGVAWPSRRTTAGCVTKEIRDEILASLAGLEGQHLEVTILFADLRDFTPWVEATPVREVVRDLGAYFTEMEQAIRGEGGLVLQFIGDEIEAAFDAQAARADHPHRAVRAALEMRRRLAAWNVDRAQPLQHGIGVHTGPVLAGNIGSAQHASYALVGDAVNLASRIQELTKEVGADVLVSGSTRARLGEEVAVAGMPPVRVKGRSKEVEVYRVL